MAMILSGKPQDFCKENCSQMELTVKSEKLYAEHAIFCINNIIVCEHETICAMWQNKEENK